MQILDVLVALVDAPEISNEHQCLQRDTVQFRDGPLMPVSQVVEQLFGAPKISS